MDKKKSLEHRLWRFSVMLHGVIFTFFWALAFYSLIIAPPYSANSTYALPILLWIPFLIAHVAAYLYYRDRPNSIELERQAYRDGFADGMRERSNMSDTYNTSRLSIDDEGELIEALPEANKRKREL